MRYVCEFILCIFSIDISGEIQKRNTAEHFKKFGEYLLNFNKIVITENSSENSL